MKRTLCIFMTVLMLTCMLPAGLGDMVESAKALEGTGEIIYGSKEMRTDSGEVTAIQPIITGEALKSAISEPSAVDVPERIITAMAGNASVGLIRFPTSDITDVQPLNVYHAFYTCMCYDGKNTVYAMDSSSNLVKQTFSPVTGGMGYPEFICSFGIGLVPNEMCYNPRTGYLYVVYAGSQIWECRPAVMELESRAFLKDQGCVAIDMMPSGAIFTVSCYGVLGSLNITSGKQTAYVNTGLKPFDGGNMYIQCGGINDGIFYWNYVDVDTGDSQLYAFNLSTREYKSMGHIFEEPGVQLHGMIITEEFSVVLGAHEEFGVFYENWEVDNLGNYTWQAVDNDGDGSTWKLDHSAYAALFEDGQNFMSNSSSDADGNARTPDDWLISQKIDLPNKEHTYLGVFMTPSIRIQVDSYEKAEIYIGPADWKELSEFTLINTTELIESKRTFIECDISSYGGQSVAIAIRHAATAEGQTQLSLDTIGIGNVHCFHDVTFIDGVTDEVLSEQSIRHGKYPSYPKKPKHDYYTFDRWSDEAQIVNDTTIYAVYTPEEFEIEYYIDNEYFDSDFVGYGLPIVLMEAPTKIGYKFNGWSEAPETMPAETVKVYGTYTAQEYTVTFVDGLTNTTISTVTVGHGGSVTLPTPPVHEGYTFVSWDNDGKCITDNTTITARYVEGSGVLLGDVNLDGEVNTGDAVLVLKVSVGAVNLDDNQKLAADYNNDGDINTGDAVAILKFSVGAKA